METGYVDDVESVDISGFSEYVNLISSRADIYGQTGVNPGQVQLLVDEHNGKTEPAVREYFESLADEELLELKFDEMNKMPDSYSMTDKGRYVLNPDKQKQLGEDYWVGQKEDLVVVFGEDYSLEQEFASETVAKTHFQRLNEENAETLLEP
jgi:hypothetical protein